MPSQVITERCGSTLVLTLSGPEKRNLLSEQLLCPGIEALNVAESNDELRTIVLHGSHGHFCVGEYLQPLAEAQAQAPLMDRLHQFIDVVRAFPKPVIAAVEGEAAGAGFSLALACDLIVAGEDARFILAPGRARWAADGGAAGHLAQLLPRQLMQQWLWLDEALSAQQLQGHGLVARVVDRGQALAEALALCRKLAAMAPEAVAESKEWLHRLMFDAFENLNTRPLASRGQAASLAFASLRRQRR